MGKQEFDAEVDALVVGAGAGGMTAALAAHAAGLDTMIVEKADGYPSWGDEAWKSQVAAAPITGILESAKVLSTEGTKFKSAVEKFLATVRAA